MPPRTVRLKPDTTYGGTSRRGSQRVRISGDGMCRFVVSGFSRTFGLFGAARELHPEAQHLGHAPRLSNTPTRRERFLRVEHLADRSDAGIVEMRDEPVERVTSAVEIVGIDLQPGIDERS